MTSTASFVLYTTSCMGQEVHKHKRVKTRTCIYKHSRESGHEPLVRSFQKSLRTPLTTRALIQALPRSPKRICINYSIKGLERVLNKDKIQQSVSNLAVSNTRNLYKANLGTIPVTKFL